MLTPKLKKYFIGAIQYMNDPDTPKPMILPFTNEEVALRTRMDFYDFRKLLRKSPQRYNPKNDPSLEQAISKADSIVARVRGNTLEFVLRDVSAVTDAFDAAFAAGNFKLDGYDPDSDNEDNEE